MRANYGLSESDYRTLVEGQQGQCAICGRIPARRRLAVDHDHETGSVRGLLCGPCNIGLGVFQDNPTILEKAAEYLRALRH